MAHEAFHVIDIEDLSTWPPEVQQRVEAIACRVEGRNGSLTDCTASEIHLAPDEEMAIQDVLHPYRVLGFHATRLAVTDECDISARGLQPLTVDLLARRLREVAASSGFSPNDVSCLIELARGRITSPEVSNRVCLSGSRSDIGEPHYCAWIRQTWGGEALSWELRDMEDKWSVNVRSRLQDIGRPAIVHVALPVDTSRYLFSPDFPQHLIASAYGRKGGPELHIGRVNAQEVTRFQYLRN